MTQETDLKAIQRKVYLTFFQDGVWDIFLGIFILGWGLSILTEAAYVPGALFVALYFTVWGIKKWLTYPRIGYVKFSSTNRQRAKARFVILLGAVLLLGVLMVVLFELDARPQWLADYFPLLFSGMLALIVCSVAYWVGVIRFYLHAVLIFLGAVIHQWFGIEWEYGFIGAGSIIVIIGLTILTGFLRKYPTKEM